MWSRDLTETCSEKPLALYLPGNGSVVAIAGKIRYRPPETYDSRNADYCICSICMRNTEAEISPDQDWYAQPQFDARKQVATFWR